MPEKHEPSQSLEGGVMPAGELAQLRAKLVLTQTALAEQLGMKRGAIAAYEGKTRPVPVNVGLAVRHLIRCQDAGRAPARGVMPAEELAQLREVLALTQTALAEQLGMKRGAIAAYEGKTRPVPVDVGFAVRELIMRREADQQRTETSSPGVKKASRNGRR
jgi:transcriptional regulator with XRE-family HTH domain